MAGPLDSISVVTGSGATQNPLSAPWAAEWVDGTTSPLLRRFSNIIRRNSGIVFAEQYYDSSVAHNHGAYVTIESLPSNGSDMGMYFGLLSGLGSSSWRGYELIYTQESGVDRLQLWRHDGSNGWLRMDTPDLMNIDFSAGWKMGATKEGASIKVWLDQGSGWAQHGATITEGTASFNTGVVKAGLQIKGTFGTMRNFGFGAIAGAGVSMPPIDHIQRRRRRS